MAGTRTGTPSIWRHAREIRRLVATYGASDMAAALGDPFATCILDLVICVGNVLLTDDYVLMKDRTSPQGPEDPL